MRVDKFFTRYKPNRKEVFDVTVSNGVITLAKPFRHKTLEERAEEFVR